MHYLVITTLFSMFFLSACTGNSEAGEEITAPNKNDSKVTSRIVDTGQDTAYNSNGEMVDVEPGSAFYGQDAHYQDTAFSFQISDDELTVLDLNTGVTWQREASEERMPWESSKQHCDNLELAGHDDWRLPSLKELISIEDFKEGWPYIDTRYFSLGDQPIGKQLQYWSSNFYLVGTTHGGADTAFGLNYGTGHIKGYPTGDQQMAAPTGGHSNENKPGDINLASENRPPPPPRNEGGRPLGNPANKLARCVYGDNYGENQFTDNGDGTINDSGTGLMWRKEDSGQGLNWEDALAYAENLEFAGYTDWKLPNVKELQSIVDYSGVYPAIDPVYFQITDKDSYFWTSTSAYFSKQGTEEQAKRNWAWYVAFGYAVGPDGEDSHGAGAVRYDSKAEGGPVGEDAERVFNYARAVRPIQ